MRRLCQLICASMGLLLILTTLILPPHRDGEGVPSLIAMQGQDSRRLVRLLPLSRQPTPLTPSLIGLEFVAWTPNGLLYTALNNQGDLILYRLPHIGATPQILAEQLQPQMVMSENGAWVVVADSGGLGGNYGLRAIRTDGTENHPLTLDLQEDLEIDTGMVPVISPDGAWIAFSVYESPGSLDVYRVRSDGSALENLTTEVTGLFTLPVAWTEIGLLIKIDLRQFRVDDGTFVPMLPELVGTYVIDIWVGSDADSDLQLIWVTDNGYSTLYGVHLDGSTAWKQPFTYANNFGVHWVLAMQDDVWVRIRTVDGAVFPTDPSFGPLQTNLMKWSPDGQSILLTNHNASGWYEIWRYDVSLDRLTRLWATPDYFQAWDWSRNGHDAVMTVHTPLRKNYLSMLDTRTGERIWHWDADYFVGWGPPYQKDWSAGWLFIIGLALTFIGAIGWPRIFRYLSNRHR